MGFDVQYSLVCNYFYWDLLSVFFDWLVANLMKVHKQWNFSIRVQRKPTKKVKSWGCGPMVRWEGLVPPGFVV